MQKFILLLVILLSANFINAQESFSQRIKEIAKEIIEVKSDEKEILSEEIDEIKRMGCRFLLLRKANNSENQEVVSLYAVDESGKERLLDDGVVARIH